MTTWIYQVNPNNFNVNGCLAEATGPVAWSVSRYREEMKSGEQVFIWRSTGDGTHGVSGIIAECKIEAPVSKMGADILTIRYSKKDDPNNIMDKSDPNKIMYRVSLRIVAVVPERDVLSRDEIADDKTLTNVGPLGFAAATNYSVTEEQSVALNALWNPRKERSKL